MDRVFQTSVNARARAVAACPGKVPACRDDLQSNKVKMSMPAFTDSASQFLGADIIDDLDGNLEGWKHAPRGARAVWLRVPRMHPEAIESQGPGIRDHLVKYTAPGALTIHKIIACFLRIYHVALLYSRSKAACANKVNRPKHAASTPLSKRRAIPVGRR